MKCLIYVGDDPTKLGLIIRTNEHVAARKIATKEWWYTDKAAWKTRKRSQHERDLENPD